jgi:glycosyltransferase involved in cell wall biosynthesis
VDHHACVAFCHAQRGLIVRVVHYLPDLELNRGGIVRAVVDLAQAQVADGWTTTVLVRNAPDAPLAWPDRDAAPVSLHLPRRRPLGLFSRSQLRALAAAFADADVLHLHNVWNPELVQLASLANQLGVATVVTPHGTFDPWSLTQSRRKKAVYVSTALRSVLRRSSAIHFTASAEREYGLPLLRKGGAESMATAVVPYLVDLDPFSELAKRHRSQNPDGPLRVLFLSRIHPKKGVEHLLDAAALLVARGLKVTVTIAGSGDPRYVSQLVAKANASGLSEVVEFVGPLLGEDRMNAFARADIFVLPTHQENFGIVLVEALAAGLPVVTTRGTDVWRELDATGGAKVLEPCDAAELPLRIADALADLVSDPDRRAAMGAAGARAVCDWLEPERTLQGFLDLYQLAVERAART